MTPWLKRTAWLKYLDGCDREELLESIRQPNVNEDEEDEAVEDLRLAIPCHGVDLLSDSATRPSKGPPVVVTIGATVSVSVIVTIAVCGPTSRSDAGGHLCNWLHEALFRNHHTYRSLVPDLALVRSSCISISTRRLITWSPNILVSLSPLPRR